MLVLADVFDKLLSSPAIVFMVGGIIAVVGIICGSICSVANRRAKEQSRRELSAYVAEGTLDPDKAIEMMKAGDGASD